MSRFVVTMRTQSPAWDYIRGVEIEVHAGSYVAAVEKARKRAEKEGKICPGQRVTFSTRKV